MRDLTQGSIPRHLIHLASFLAISMAFQTLYLLVDLYFVSALGKDAIAGVGLAGNLMLAVVAVTQVLGVGCTSLIARAAGQKDKATAQLVFNQALVLAAMACVVTILVGELIRMPYCRAISADEATLRQGDAYLKWFIPSLGIQFGLAAMGSSLRGAGVVKPMMIVQVATVVINVVLAPVLIAGWGGGPALGVRGAAIATLLSVILGLTAITLYVAKSDGFLVFKPALWTPRLDIWKRIANIGLPAGGEFGVLAIYSAAVYWLVRDFGAAAQAGYGVGGRVMQSLFLPVLSISFAVSPLAGQNLGAGHSDRVRQTFRSAALLSLSLMGAVTLSCQLSPSSAIRWFTQDESVVAFGAEYLRILSWGFPAAGLVFTTSGMFQALGNTWPSLASSISRLLLFLAAAAWLSTRAGFAPIHLWYASVAAGLLQASANLTLLRREFRRKLPPAR